MDVTKERTNTNTSKTDDQKCERVEEFKFLRTVMTEGNYIGTEIMQRINVANKISYELKKQLKWQNLKRQTKCMLYTTLTRPTLTYGSECRRLSKKGGNTLRIFERRILGMFYTVLLTIMVQGQQDIIVSFLPFTMNRT